MMKITTFLTLALLPAALQAQQGPAVQKIATATALSTERIGIITSVRELPDGRLLVNDVQRRRLLLMDSTMKVVGAVLDSTSSNANFYGTQQGILVPFRGDTTFFVDPVAYAMLVIDPQGRVVRVRSIWRVQDMRFFGGFSEQAPAGDAKGRVIYRNNAQPAPPKVRPPAGVPYIPTEPDSAFIVAMHLETRKLDTLAVIHTPKIDQRIRQMGTGGFMIDRVVNPLPLTDEWAVLPDGTLAIVRGREYRIDYLHPDGTKTSSPRIPFDWQRLTDEDKQRLIDSTKTAQQKMMQSQYVSSMIRWVNQYNRNYPKNFTVPEGFTLQPGFPKDWILPPGVKFPADYIYACAPGTDMMTAMSTMGPGGRPSCYPAPVSFSSGMVPQQPTIRPVLVASPLDLPDYRPPFPQGSVRADADGNLWVRTNPMKPTPGGPVFDVISPTGELFTRLQLPPGYNIVGFGKGRVVYLVTRDMQGLHLARVRLKDGRDAT